MADELRLLYSAILNGLLFWAALTLVRRIITRELLAGIADALLLYYAAQYVIVGVSGMCGVLGLAAIAIGTVVLSAIPFFLKNITDAETLKKMPSWRSLAILAVALFTIFFGIDIAWQTRQYPVMGSDAMTYHLPTAVQWLQTGRLGYYPVWYYNPANTYSPLAGSMFTVWLMIPMGSDVLARFVDIGPWLLIFFAMIQIGRSLEADDLLAVLSAAAAVMMRSFVSQTILQKDDLFLVAFFACLVAGLAPRKLPDRFGPWRVGIALGLLLATKYTAAFSLPMLILAIDAPFRAKWNWRHWAIALTCAALLAGPWYLRNWIFMGNPLFPVDVSVMGIPVFRGLFSTHVTKVLRTVAGIRNTLIGGYYGVPPVPAAMLAVAWLAAALAGWCAIAHRPVARLCLLGPPMAIALFIWASPYADIRFELPAVLLLFTAGAMALATLRPVWLAWPFALAMLIAALATGFPRQWVGWFLAETIPMTLLVLGAFWLQTRRLKWSKPARYTAALAIGALAAACLYGYWPAFFKSYQTDQAVYRNANDDAIAQAWDFLRQQLPPDATVAYANTYFTYPLYDARFQRRVLHVSTNPALKSFANLPRFPRAVEVNDILPEMLKIQFANPIKEAWLRRLKQSKAAYLFIVKTPLDNNVQTTAPPELEFANTEPGIFQRIEIANDADGPILSDVCALYEIHWPKE